MSLPVHIVGYGRFGAALADLFVEAGHAVRATDPVAEVPPELAGALPAGPAAVVLCVPVQAVGDALASVEGTLGPEHLVVDVSSVRAPVEELFAERLGARVPWVGTHPLFGPSSIARGERPMRVVICPNDQHPDAAARAVALYRGIGCEVLEETAADHDRSMAYSHALAFYLAKGMLDIDATARTHFVPPSFQAMLRTIESVRSDAGHLFLAIERLNPYAAEARGDLLSALGRLHDELLAVDPTALDESGDLNIPDLGVAAPELGEVREAIDALDRELVQLIAQRTEVARRIGRIKGARALPVRDAVRERALLEKRRGWAEEEALDPDGVARVFEELMGLSRRSQERGE